MKRKAPKIHRRDVRLAGSRAAETAHAIGNLLAAHASQPASKTTLRDVALSTTKAAIIKAMLARGDRTADVAVYFDLCLQTVEDVASGKRFAEVQPALSDDLPRAGFYIRPRDSRRLKMAIDYVSLQLEMAVRSKVKIESDFHEWFREAWLDSDG